jgi:N-methylhydantoinase A
VRTATIEQGYDPSDFVLYAYGGAGPSHAFSYGAELGAKEIVVPLTASVHSAFGVASSDITVAEELSDPLISPPGTEDYADAIDADAVNARLDRLVARATKRLVDVGIDPGEIRVARFVELRFRFQIHVLSIPVTSSRLYADDIRELVARFIETYEARFGEGSAFEAAGVEITTFKVVARVATAAPQLRRLPVAESNGHHRASHRPVFAGGEWHQAQVLDQASLAPGLQIEGVSIVDMPDTTVVVGRDQMGRVDDYGNVIISSRT